MEFTYICNSAIYSSNACFGMTGKHHFKVKVHICKDKQRIHNLASNTCFRNTSSISRWSRNAHFKDNNPAEYKVKAAFLSTKQNSWTSLEIQLNVSLNSPPRQGIDLVKRESYFSTRLLVLNKSLNIRTEYVCPCHKYLEARQPKVVISMTAWFPLSGN